MALHVESPARGILASRIGEFLHITALYVRSGERKSKGHLHGTVLLRDVRDADSGEMLTDHLWFNRGRMWRAANLCPGDTVEFYARAIEYRTGYWGPNRVRRAEAPARRDYRLTPPVGLTVITGSGHVDEEAA